MCKNFVSPFQNPEIKLFLEWFKKIFVAKYLVKSWSTIFDKARFNDMVGAELIQLDAVIEPSSRWRFGGKLGAANWDKGERRIARGGGMCRWGGRWVGEGATCRSSSSPPINTSLLSRCTDTIGGWIPVSGVFALKKAHWNYPARHRWDLRPFYTRCCVWK